MELDKHFKLYFLRRRIYQFASFFWTAVDARRVRGGLSAPCRCLIDQYQAKTSACVMQHTGDEKKE